MAKKPIPSIDVPIMLENGSMELAWYLYLKYGVSTGATGDIGDGRLTLKQDNVTIGEFSANQKENTEVNIAGTSSNVSDVKVDGVSVVTNKIANIDLTGKQATLVSGTNIKTVNSTSLLGSGNIAVQPTLVSGTNIKTINSTSVLGSGNIAVQPTITGGAATITSSNLTANRALVSNASGKVAVSEVTSTQLGYLSGVTSAIQTQLNGKQATISDLATIRSGAALGATAAQPAAVTNAISTHNADNTAHSDIRSAVASKSTVSVSATGTATAEVKYITIDGVEKKIAGGSGGGSEEDNLSITKNASDKIQTVGVIDQNDTTNAIHTWTGTLAEYEAIITKDADTLYNITDDVAGGDSVYSKAQIDSLLLGKANTNLSNTPNNIDYVVVFQRPTADNNYTWYRKYKSGWVEQGQKITDATSSITLPIAMANDWYTITTAQNGGASGTISRCAITGQTTTGFTIVNNAANMRPIFWQASGMAAEQ